MPYVPEFLEQQKDRLLAEKRRLEEELGRIAKKDPRVADDYDAAFPDYGRSEEENALEEERYAARISTENTLELHLRDVNNALVRLENVAYGICTVCQKEIGEERLRANPAATTCTAHASSA